MTDVRTFRAKSMREALDLVRRELGHEAVILHTRHVAKRRLWPWKPKRERVEVTAGLGVNIRSQQSAPSPDAVQPSLRAAGIVDVTIGGQYEPIDHLTAVTESQPQPPTNRAHHFQAPRQQEENSDLNEKLDAIQSLLRKLDRSQLQFAPTEIPSDLFDLYTELIDSEVDDEVARELVNRLQRERSDDTTSRSADRAMLRLLVEADLNCSGPITLTPGRRKVVALIGATGVGKTTTIAKLAAQFRLRDNVKMGLVTVDTYRIAAVEQLRTYAEIISLPMKVVTNAAEMSQALDEFNGLDLVLIDTAGRSPRDELQLSELQNLLNIARVDEAHLVLSLTASTRHLLAAAQKFATVNPTHLILTKLDEAAGLGGVLSLSRKSPLPISYLTTGQNVPDDIEPADASRLARRLLGENDFSGRPLYDHTDFEFVNNEPTP